MSFSSFLNNYLAMRFEVFTVVKIQVEVFWVVMPCSVVAGHQQFGGTCCLHLHQHYAASQLRRPQPG